MINYSLDLNPQQLEVVQNGNGPCLVLAGAGSGKTRTITYRVAYLLEQGISPDNILLLTFTNKAANEMIERIKALTGMEFRLPYAGTFHSLANKILRREVSRLGYRSNFTILDEDDSKSILKLSINEFKPDSGKKFPSVNVVKSIISFGRNAQIKLEEVLDDKYPQFMEWSSNLVSIAKSYDTKKKQSNSMDFDDLLVNWLLLLNNPEVLERYTEQFKYILVDEYQDTNKIQASIIKKLSLKHSNLLVVGDDAQSIYSFRAADIANILDFEKKYPNAKIFKLETNYRSSQEILQIANEVISNNLKQYQKQLNTVFTTGVKPVLNPTFDQREEALFIANTIKKQIDNNESHSQIAVLFRAAFHSQMLEMELVKRGIDYDYRGGLRFFDRAHVKDVLAFLRLLNNLSDSAAWMRVLSFQEGIGPVGVQRFISAVKDIKNIGAVTDLGNELFNGRARNGWDNFLSIWQSVLEVGKQDVAGLIMTIRESNYQEYLEAEYENAKDRLDDIEQLAVFAESANNLEEFLAEASLQENYSSAQINQDTDRSSDKIILSTIHQAKGLEWDNVFVLNLSSGAFPSDRAWKEENGIEEERRLFYVAVTRAKRNLYLTYPQESANSWSGSGGPSLFVEEIPIDLLDDKSFLSNNSSVFDDLDDEEADVSYVSEDEQYKRRPGSFLIDI